MFPSANKSTLHTKIQNIIFKTNFNNYRSSLATSASLVQKVWQTGIVKKYYKISINNSKSKIFLSDVKLLWDVLSKIRELLGKFFMPCRQLITGVYSGHCQVSNLECFFEIVNLTNFLLDDIKAKQRQSRCRLVFCKLFFRRIQQTYSKLSQITKTELFFETI